MTAQPLVSIIVTSYNYERYLAQTIDSALGQTYPHVEVIVVDDGSTDGSPAVMASYGDAIRAIYKPNGGQASSANAGFAASRGELVMFLDSDDALMPHAIERVVAAFRPGVSKVQFRLTVVDAEGVPTGATLPAAGYHMPTGNQRAMVLKGKVYPAPPTSGNVYARSVLERILPMPEAVWKGGIDAYQFTLAALFGEIVSLPEPGGLYRVHGKNMWATSPGAGSHSDLTVERLTKYLRYVHNRAALIQEWADRGGLKAGPHLAFQYPGETARAMVLQRLAPDHPFVAAHGRWWLAWRGALATLTEPYRPGIKRRLGEVAWFFAMALLPRAQAIALAEWTFGRQRRMAASLAPRQA